MLKLGLELCAQAIPGPSKIRPLIISSIPRRPRQASSHVSPSNAWSTSSPRPYIPYSRRAEWSPGIRWNSSSSSSTSTSVKRSSPPKPTELSIPQEAKQSFFARITSNLSLTPVSTPAVGEQGSSSVGKLIDLARPESRALGLGVGLVSYSKAVYANGVSSS